MALPPGIFPPALDEEENEFASFQSGLEMITSEYHRLRSENKMLRERLLGPAPNSMKVLQVERHEAPNPGRSGLEKECSTLKLTAEATTPPPNSPTAFRSWPYSTDTADVASTFEHPFVVRSQDDVSESTFKTNPEDEKQRVGRKSCTKLGTKVLLGDKQAELQESLAAAYAYDVRDFYHSTGLAQAIARHYLFDRFAMCVIVLNAIWIAIDTDYNDADVINNATPLFQTVEECFTIFFFLELLIRFLAFREKRSSLRDTWFAFDSLMVLLMVIDNWILALVVLESSSISSATSRMSNLSILRLLRLVRLVKLLRSARVVTYCPEMFILVKAIGIAARCVGFTLGLLLCVLYVFSIAFTQLLRDTDSGNIYFPTVLYSFSTLIFKGPILDSPSVLSSALLQDSWIAYAVYIVFILLSSVTIMNLLTGLIVTIINAISAAEKETTQMDRVRDVLVNAFKIADLDQDNKIEKNEFLAMLQNEDAISALEGIGIDIASLQDFADLFYESQRTMTRHSGKGGPKLPFDEVTSKVLMLRRGNVATVMDLIVLRRWFAHQTEETDKKLTRLASGSTNPRYYLADED